LSVTKKNATTLHFLVDDGEESLIKDVIRTSFPDARFKRSSLAGRM
jgi:hypothetical protein